MSSNRRWTDQQWEAITSAGGSLLVSAAAGSGKTSVLAERCVYLVCDGPRCHVNQLLVVTFTEATAAEMKGRIEQALRQRLEKQGEDAHLRRQFALLEHASISTLHGFCHRLLREHFHRLGLDPGFRVLDADEAMLMRMEVVRGLFQERYDREGAEEFHRFIDSFGEGNDEGVMETVVRTHEMLCSLVDPQGWMAEADRRIAEAAKLGVDGSELGREHLEGVTARLDALERDCQAANSALARMKGFEGYVTHVEYLLSTVRRWKEQLTERGYDGLAGAVRETEIPKLPSIRSGTPGKETASELISAVQKQFKEGPLVEGLRFSAEEWQEGVRSVRTHTRVFLELVADFVRRYRKEKDAVRAVDFADLERFALRLLLEDASAKRKTQNANVLRPSAVARMLHRQYQHVLVDEYQDINEVQDAILTLASRECRGEAEEANLFCVGDVKQSIYRFRLAEPTRFLERSERMRGAAGKVIHLQANFRSRRPLLDAVNRVFERLMTREAAEIQYDQSHWLHAHAEFPAAEELPSFRGAPIELHYLPEKVQAEESDDSEDAELERSEREALVVARRIEEMMGQHGGARMCVAERGTLRPIEYKDIVILLRATRFHADQYAEVLRRRGIPVFNAGGGGYFDAMEVRDMLSLLRLLDNQRQDIPMAAVLRSPLSGLPRAEDALGRIRLAYPQVPFHEAVVRYARERQDELAAKLRDFLHELEEWRQLVRQRPVAELIWTIYERTGYLAFCNGLENGQQRCANLIHLYERARQFGTFSRQGLYRFIRFLESLREETDAAQAPQISEAENVVRIMSVHKSKGLEFPVVIAPELGKRINFQGCAGNIVADRRGYLGLCAVDESKRIRYPSLASMLVSERLRRQTIAEELRVLYVAMTRAKEHLILIGTCKENASENWSRAWDLHQGALPPNTILSAKTMLDWLGPVAAALSGDGGQTMQVYDHPAEEIAAWMAEVGEKRTKSEAAEKLARLEPLDPEPAENAVATRVIERLRWTYPYQAFSRLQASMAVTGMAKKEPVKISTGSKLPVAPAAMEEPRFLLDQPQVSAAERGTAVHLFMEHLEFDGACDEADLLGQLERLVEKRIMTAAQADVAREELGTVRWFLETEVGHLVRQNAKRLRRELALNYALPAERLIGVASGEAMDQVMVRGRIDLLVPAGEELVLIDYKTDRVWGEALAERSETYRPQMEMYREAIGRITSKTVGGAYLVFLFAKRVVSV